MEQKEHLQTHIHKPRQPQIVKNEWDKASSVFSLSFSATKSWRKKKKNVEKLGTIKQEPYGNLTERRLTKIAFSLCLQTNRQTPNASLAIFQHVELLFDHNAAT